MAKLTENCRTGSCKVTKPAQMMHPVKLWKLYVSTRDILPGTSATIVCELKKGDIRQNHNFCWAKYTATVQNV